MPLEPPFAVMAPIGTLPSCWIKAPVLLYRYTVAVEAADATLPAFPIEKLTVSPEPASNELLLSDRLLITRSGRDGVASIVNSDWMAAIVCGP